jgi:hypothetical protein
MGMALIPAARAILAIAALALTSLTAGMTVGERGGSGSRSIGRPAALLIGLVAGTGGRGPTDRRTRRSIVARAGAIGRRGRRHRRIGRIGRIDLLTAKTRGLTGAGSSLVTRFPVWQTRTDTGIARGGSGLRAGQVRTNIVCGILRPDPAAADGAVGVRRMVEITASRI